MSAYPHIFQPLAIGPVTAKNRIEIAPATPFLADHDGSMSPELRAYTMNLAASGVGIMTTGIVSVDPTLAPGSRTIRGGSILLAADLEEMAEIIHAQGALASAEIVSTQYMLMPPEKVVGETSTGEVEGIIERYANAARLLANCGFDIMFIHGGHGNVPSMFFAERFNHRTDRFGGSFEGRSRFAIELADAVREATGGRCGIEYRISAEEVLPGTTTLDETLKFAKLLEPHIDMLHVSRALLSKDELLPYINTPLYLPRAINQPYARRFKDELSIPVSVVNGYDLEHAEQAIAAGDADAVSMIRSIYADTRCVRKAATGREAQIRPCVRCNTCIGRTHSYMLEVRCAVNPVLGRETHLQSATGAAGARIAYRKRILVAGGGPAGMEAARIAADLGHEVTLVEQADHLGGKFELAAALKPELARYLQWSVSSTLNDPRITVELETPVTPELVAERQPDALLLAFGARPTSPCIEGAGDEGAPRVLQVEQAVLEPESLGERVLVAGTGLTGMEFALELAHRGVNVELAGRRPADQTGRGGSTFNLICLRQLLQEAQVPQHHERELVGVTQGAALLKPVGAQAGEPVEQVACDTVVLALGSKPVEEELAAFEGCAPFVRRIGDCAGGGTLFGCTHSAYDALLAIETLGE